ncbi:C2 domain protein [Cooperia oncophora]
MEYLTVFNDALEDVNGYNGFEDFLDTFKFVKSSRGNYDDPEEKEKSGELKGKVFITPITGKDDTGKWLQSVPEGVRRKTLISLKKKYRADTLDPVFGEFVEMEVNIPVEKDLVITVMDYRKVISDDKIGSTKIDLENRLLTKWRATVGLSAQYTIQGEMQWRDQQTPLATLRGYCKKFLVEPPVVIEKQNDIGLKILGIDFWYSQVQQEMDE